MERERLGRLEAILVEHEAVLERMRTAMDGLESAVPAYEELKAYYMSAQYLEDHESGSEASLGVRVTSEDAVYELIEAHYETALRMLELATALIRQH